MHVDEEGQCLGPEGQGWQLRGDAWDRRTELRSAQQHRALGYPKMDLLSTASEAVRPPAPPCPCALPQRGMHQLRKGRGAEPWALCSALHAQ